MGGRLKRLLDSETGPWNPSEPYGGFEATAAIDLRRGNDRRGSFAATTSIVGFRLSSDLHHPLGRARIIKGLANASPFSVRGT